MITPKNDQTQKSGYDIYWSSLFDYILANGDEYNKLKTEWEAINQFEQESASSHYSSQLIDGEIYSYDNGCAYINDKAEHISRLLSSIVTPRTDCVIELGSGWGRNILSNHFLNPEWSLYGGELTNGGQKVLDYFCKKYELPVTSFPFNWCDTGSIIDFFKDKSLQEVVIYSIHSIEQVSYLNIEEFQNILNLPFRIKFLHVEPCAWQWELFRKRVINGWNENFKTVLNSLMESGKINGLKVNPLAYKPNFQGSGFESITITYEKA